MAAICGKGAVIQIGGFTGEVLNITQPSRNSVEVVVLPINGDDIELSCFANSLGENCLIDFRDINQHNWGFKAYVREIFRQVEMEGLSQMTIQLDLLSDILVGTEVTIDYTFTASESIGDLMRPTIFEMIRDVITQLDEDWEYSTTEDLEEIHERLDEEEKEDVQDND